MPNFAKQFKQDAADHAVRTSQEVDLVAYAGHLMSQHGSYRHIAATYGCSQPNVSQFFKRIGFKQNNRLTEEQIELIAQWVRKDENAATISRKPELAGIKKTTIYQHIRRYHRKAQ